MMSHAAAKNIALYLIDAEGSDPEFTSIHEAVGEYMEANGEEFDTDVIDEYVSKVNRLISGAVFTITFPEELVEETR